MNRRKFLASLGAMSAVGPGVFAAQPPPRNAAIAFGDASTMWQGSPPAITMAPGWVPLFDGQTLKGWRGYKKPDAAPSRWRVENGMLTLPPKDGKDTGGAFDLITAATYDQFELAFEWRIAPAGNSGVKYFVLEDMDTAIGHEYQIIDDEKHPDARFGPERQTAAFYDVLAASNRPVRSVGEFNESRIIVDGTRAEHWLNGTRVLQYELKTPALQAAVADSKFKTVARFGTRQKGHILLQDHGDQVWYRNIRIRQTSPS
ncbi:MAG: DUF1080 domain-containing protein [Vicinamibacterales bacterium]